MYARPRTLVVMQLSDAGIERTFVQTKRWYILMMNCVRIVSKQY